MGYGVGKDFLLYIGSVGAGVLVAKATSNNIDSTVSFTTITNKGSGGHREILPSSGIESNTISIQGIYSDDAGLATLEANKKNKTNDDYYMQYPLLDSGNSTKRTDSFSARVTNLSTPSEHEGEMTFSATLEVSEAITTVAES